METNDSNLSKLIIKKEEGFMFTSESVSEGHPDKIADQISDAILDEILENDIDARVACETMINTGMVIVSGEITTTAVIDINNVVRQTLKQIGYQADMGFDWEACAVLTSIDVQSEDIAQGVNEQEGLYMDQGAGDQGLMFGYATNESSEYMPMPIYLAHKLMRRQSELRKSGDIAWLRPDAKSQVTVKYENHKPIGIDTIVLSTQHEPDVSYNEIKETVIDEIIKPTLPAEWINDEIKYYINPTGRFVVGGPVGDCGLTGRKIIVDTYGGMSRHGGGAFSGKDPSKVDRSAAYAARYVAKNIVAAGLADRCELQIAYAIGVADPVAIYIETFGTGRLPDVQIAEIVKYHFDLRPKAIIEHLDLLKPIYKQTAAYGHFGRSDQAFSWERCDMVETLREAAALTDEKLNLA